MGLQFGTGCPNNGSMVSNFREVVELWDTPDVLASEIGVGVSAARKWPQRNNIPAEWWSAVLGTAVAQEAGLTAEMFTGFAARSPVAAEPEEARA